MKQLHRLAKTSTDSIHKNYVTLTLLMVCFYLHAQLWTPACFKNGKINSLCTNAVCLEDKSFQNMKQKIIVKVFIDKRIGS